uniref:Transposase n=1 Tax=Aromatoleum anaerobium TaxID=182180 RepID=A0ABX1PTQ8_9RHOO
MADRAPPRPTRDDFCVGNRVSFDNRHLQTRIGTILRINQRTASVDCDEQSWRVPFGLLRHIVDL